MTERIIDQRKMKVHNRRSAFLLFIAVMAVVAGFLSTGCAGQKATPAGKHQRPVEMLYEVSDQEALNLAQWAINQALPDQNVMRLEKPRLGFLVHETVQKGYGKYARFRDAVFIYEIDLLRMAGSTSQGQNIVGYTFSVNGDGDLKTGPETLARLEHQLQETFEQTGRAVAVSSSRLQKQAPQTPALISPGSTAVSETPVPPKSEPSTVDKTSGEIPSGKPAVKEAPAAVVPMATVKEQPAKDEDLFMKLKKLKELRDQKIITEEEFQSKKKELLDRI